MEIKLQQQLKEFTPSIQESKDVVYGAQVEKVTKVNKTSG